MRVIQENLVLKNYRTASESLQTYKNKKEHPEDTLFCLYAYTKLFFCEEIFYITYVNHLLVKHIRTCPLGFNHTNAFNLVSQL